MKAVNDAIGQGCLWSDNSQLNSFFLSYFSQRFYIGRAKSQSLGYLSGAGITWSGINLFNLGALG